MGDFNEIFWPMLDILAIVLLILFIIELWLIFKKCNKKGWLAIIPIANLWVLFTIIDLPGWLSLVPVANFVTYVLTCFKLPKKLGKSSILGIGILLLPQIFLGFLAFGKNGKKEEKVESFNENIEEASIDSPSTVPEITDVVKSNEEVVEAPDLMASPTENEVNNALPSEPENKGQGDIPEMPELDLGTPEEFSEVVPAAPVVEEPKEEINAFDMPVPSANDIVINDIPEVAEEVSENVTPTVEAPVDAPVVEEPMDLNNQLMEDTNIVTPLPEEIPNTDVPAVETPVVETIEEVPNTNNTLPEDNLEATFELPKMANEIINSGISETKVCPNCGHANEYANKTCVMCGSNLE